MHYLIYYLQHGETATITICHFIEKKTVAQRG